MRRKSWYLFSVLVKVKLKGLSVMIEGGRGGGGSDRLGRERVASLYGPVITPPG